MASNVPPPPTIAPIPSSPVGAPAAAPPAPAPPPPRRLSRPLLAALAVVVVALLVLAALSWAGIGPLARPSSRGGSGGALTFSQAWKEANASANSYGPGPWSAFAAFGVDSSAAVPLNNSAVLPANYSTECSGTSLVAAGALPAVPAYSGNLSAGASPFWLFVESSSASSLLLLLGVVGGQASVWEKFSGSACGEAAALLPGLPGDTVSSPAAVRAALGAVGSGFLAAHPGGALAYAVEPTIALLGITGSWQIVYSTCPVSGPPVAGTAYYGFNATVGLTSGTVTSVESGPQNCSASGLVDLDLGGGSTGGTDLGLALTVSAATENSSGDWDVPVRAAASGLEIHDLDIEVVDASGAEVSTLPLDELLSVTGCALAEGTPGVDVYIAPLYDACPSGTLGSEAAVTAGETIVLVGESPGAGTGDTLEIVGESGYSGTISVPL